MSFWTTYVSAKCKIQEQHKLHLKKCSQLSSLRRKSQTETSSCSCFHSGPGYDSCWHFASLGFCSFAFHAALSNVKPKVRKKTHTKLKCSNQYKSTYIYKQINAMELYIWKNEMVNFQEKKKQRRKQILTRDMRKEKWLYNIGTTYIRQWRSGSWAGSAKVPETT